ncbi:MAG: signal recognition particle-docking protein FtsY [Chloroflexi bacterium]|nr:signal recognition particle-docking protein FtsY [Chloroflexota bacterium]
MEETPAVVEEEPKLSFFEKLKKGLGKTRDKFIGNITDLLPGRTKLDEDFWDELEETLILSDVGGMTSAKIVDDMRDKSKRGRIKEPSEVLKVLRDNLAEIMDKGDTSLKIPEGELVIILVVGVNGTGKTTSIGKLAYRLKKEGRKVILAAGDTFRAAASEQLQIWGQRVGAEVIRHNEGADPAAVIFDAIKAARSRGADIVIADTAGRLHSKVNLMEELKKIRRIIGREVEGAPQEVLLVLDATTGQNALQQARVFKEAVDLTGIVITKMDGSAKGGILFAISDELKIPVKFVGLGEGIEDLETFDPKLFMDALIQVEEG